MCRRHSHSEGQGLPDTNSSVQAGLYWPGSGLQGVRLGAIGAYGSLYGLGPPLAVCTGIMPTAAWAQAPLRPGKPVPSPFQARM